LASTNPLAQNSKLENNAWMNASLPNLKTGTFLQKNQIWKMTHQVGERNLHKKYKNTGVRRIFGQNFHQTQHLQLI